MLEIKEIDLRYEWKNTRKKKQKNVFIDVEVDKGDKYFFGNVSIVGNNIFSTNELLSDFKRQEGEVYEEAVHLGDIQSIYDKYRNNGYIFSRITALDDVNEETKEINYLIDIFEGEIGHIENIYIDGLTKTKENVVTRELLFKKGEIFNLDKIRNSYRNLTRLGYFDVLPPEYRIGSVEGLMDVYLNFVEKRTTTLSAGISYGFTSGFSVNADLKDNNFLGYGYRVGIKGSLGLNVKDLTLSFTDPWFLNKPVSVGTSFTIGKYYNNFGVSSLTNAGRVTSPDGGERGIVNAAANSIQYTSDLISFTLFSGQRFLNWYQIRETFSVNYVNRYLQNFKIWPEAYSQQELYDANRHLFNTPPPDGETRLYYTLSLLLQRDNRDSILNPTDGELVSLTSTLFFGDFSLTEWRFNFGVYRSIPWQFKGISNFRMKLTFVYKNNLNTFGDSILGDFVYDPINYYLLSERDIRGWGRDDLRDFLRDRYGTGVLFTENLYPLGLATFRQNFEIRQNVLIDLIQVLYFLDAAAISNKKLSFSDLSTWSFIFNWKNYVYSTGFGLRLNLPQLPLRFYFSWKFIYDQNMKTFKSFNQNKFDDNINYIPDFTLDIQGFF